MIADRKRLEKHIGSAAILLVEHALDVVASGGRVSFLLRLGFLAGQKRYAWHVAHRPAFIDVHCARPRFSGATSSDFSDYAHFTWIKGCGSVYPVLGWLP